MKGQPVNSENDRSSLTRFAWLSIAAAVVTIGLKLVAYRLTGSVGLLSDAIESVVNLVGGIMALAMLTIAARPADEDHPFGHHKAEYFSSGVEGSLILLAAVSIGYAAVGRLLAPKPLEQIGLGLLVSVLASLVNLVVALLLLRVGRKRHSITLEANAQHLLTDVWTSVGVLFGVGAVALTGWQRLDPIVALAAAANWPAASPATSGKPFPTLPSLPTSSPSTPQPPQPLRGLNHIPASSSIRRQRTSAPPLPLSWRTRRVEGH